MRPIPCPIDLEVLRGLYVEQKLTDQQIAQQIGQGATAKRVRSWRSRFGIPSIPRWERNVVTPIEGVLKSLLIGSMLGDGRLVGTRHATHYAENHTDSQKAYLEWKAQIWGPWATPIMPVIWRAGGKEYPGWRFRTCAHGDLNPYRDLFYPTRRGRGVKRLLPEVVELVDERALAIWYLDDGHAGWWPAITFGMLPKDKAIAAAIFEKFGLSPRWEVKKGNTGVFHFERESTAHQFLSLITPHVPACMKYKVASFGFQGPHYQVRQRIDVDAVRLFAAQGFPIRRMASHFGVGASTISRFLRKHKIDHPRRIGRPSASKWSQSEIETRLAGYGKQPWVEIEGVRQEEQVQDIRTLLRLIPFPYPSRPALEQARKQFDQVVDAEMRLEDSKIAPNRRMGLALCTPFFPNRYEARAGRAKSAWAAWHSDSDLRRAIRFQLKVGDPVLPHRVLRAVTMNCRTPTVFRPTVARFVYERYCTSGDLVWDPCAGYGGRLVGALAAGVRYLGTDVEQATVDGNLELASVLGLSDRAGVICSPAETFDPPKDVQLVFTSPPYFHQERYQGGKQTWKNYPTVEEWLEGFLRPVIRAARVAPVLALNIADVSGIPLEEHTKQVAQEEGWVLEETLKMPLATLNRKRAEEPVLVFRQA